MNSSYKPLWKLHLIEGCGYIKTCPSHTAIINAMRVHLYNIRPTLWHTVLSQRNYLPEDEIKALYEWHFAPLFISFSNLIPHLISPTPFTFSSTLLFSLSLSFIPCVHISLCCFLQKEESATYWESTQTLVHACTHTHCMLISAAVGIALSFSPLFREKLGC